MDGAQAPIDAITPRNETYRVAYMPPATEFNYYIAIGEGIKVVAEQEGVEVFMLAPQSGADINGQMGMIQDVLTQDVDAIIFGTHDEFAAAPLIQRAVDQGHRRVVMINSDIPNFPTPDSRCGGLFAAQRHPRLGRLGDRDLWR
jgi:ribose transport system substrate-binding protein